MKDIKTYEPKEKEITLTAGKLVFWTVFLVIGAILIITALSSFYTVSAGERGVLLKFGNPDPLPRGEGLHFKVPIMQKAVIMDVQTQKYETPLTAASKDLQDVKTTTAINYRIVPERAPEIYQTIGLSYADKIIYPMEQEVNKGITAQFTAEELITKREEVRELMKQSLTDRLRDRGIIIEEVSIINFEFSPSFSNAIEQKVTADQLRRKAETDLQRIDLEAQAIKLQREQLSPEYLRFKELEIQRTAVDKWNGNLPYVTGGSTPFIDMAGMGINISR